jgi:hypothetical protein
MDSYKKKRNDLRDRKREVMEEEFRSSDERRAVVKSFKRESRSIKRSERNEIKRELRDKYGI